MSRNTLFAFHGGPMLGHVAQLVGRVVSREKDREEDEASQGREIWLTDLMHHCCTNQYCTEAPHSPRTHTKSLYPSVQVQQDILQAKTGLTGITGVLRFLQLLCEGHHLQLQDYLREQSDSSLSVNIPTEIMQFLNELIAEDMDASVFGIATQTFHTLTEVVCRDLSLPVLYSYLPANSPPPPPRTLPSLLLPLAATQHGQAATEHS